MQWVAYFLLAIYLSNVLKNEVGTRRSVWYPLMLSYWVPRPAAKAAALQAVLAETQQAAAGSGGGGGGRSRGRGVVGRGRVGRGPGEEALEEDVGMEEEKMREWLMQQTGRWRGW